MNKYCLSTNSANIKQYNPTLYGRANLCWITQDVRLSNYLHNSTLTVMSDYQGGGTHVCSVLRSSSAVKILAKIFFTALHRFDLMTADIFAKILL